MDSIRISDPSRKLDRSARRLLEQMVENKAQLWGLQDASVHIKSPNSKNLLSLYMSVYTHNGHAHTVVEAYDLQTAIRKSIDKIDGQLMRVSHVRAERVAQT